MNPGPPGVPEIPDTTPQAAAFHAVSRTSRRVPAAIAVGAVGLIVIALLTRTSESVVSLTPDAMSPSAAGPVAPSAPVVAEGSPSDPAADVPPARDAEATTLELPVDMSVVAGVAEVTAGPNETRVTFELGDDWIRIGDSLYLTGADDTTGMSIGAWAVSSVNLYPCRWASGEVADPELLRTAEGQAHALSSFWGQDPRMPADSNDPIAPVATRPERSDIGGYPAWHLEVLIPTGLDPGSCDGNQVILWQTEAGQFRPALAPGEIIRIWVADVNGGPIAIAASSTLSATPETTTTLERVVASIAIDP